MSGGLFAIALAAAIGGVLLMTLAVSESTKLGIAVGAVMLAVTLALMSMSFMFKSMTEFRLALSYEVRTFEYEVFEDEMKKGIDNSPQCVKDLEANGWSAAFIEDSAGVQDPKKMFRVKILVKDSSKKPLTLAEKYDSLK